MLTDCTTKSISLSSLRRQKLLLEFDGGRITSDAGAVLLREADRRLKLVRLGRYADRCASAANVAECGGLIKLFL